jgi:hypothetical protein
MFTLLPCVNRNKCLFHYYIDLIILLLQLILPKIGVAVVKFFLTDFKSLHHAIIANKMPAGV